MSAARHPNKEIRAAVAYAIACGWRYIEAGRSAHVWGFLYCPEETRDGHRVRIYSTPRVPEDHAKDIARAVRTCPHSKPKTT